MIKKARTQSLLERQLKKHGLTDAQLPERLEDWQAFLSKVLKVYEEYDEARMSSENVLAVSLAEMERMQNELSASNQKEQRELNEYLRLILNASEMGVWDWNIGKNQIKFDSRWCEILGLEIESVSGDMTVFKERIHPQDQARFFSLIDDYLASKISRFEIQIQMKHAKGHWVDILSKGKSIQTSADGKILRFLGTHFDMTEEKNLQREIDEQRIKLVQTSKLASLGEMSAGIAHEINNPLTIISGTIFQLPRLIADPQKLSTKLEVMNKACLRIAKIVGGLRKFSRSGQKSKLEAYSIGTIIKESVVLTESKAKHLDVLISVEDVGDLKIWCDEIEIEQVLVNLINNAMDAIKELEHRWIKISVFETDVTVGLRVIDSGAGIPDEVEKKLFQPFFTTKKIGEGTGLGLSISKGILEEHQASIRVAKEFTNTCFEIQFPKAIDSPVPVRVA